MILIAVNQYGQFLCKWKIDNPIEKELIIQNNPNDYFIEEEFNHYSDYWDFNLKQWVNIGEMPSSFHYFNYELKKWQDTRSIEEIKNHKWQEIKSQRELLEFSGVFFNGHNYDCDLISQQRLTTAISLNKDMVWKTKDNQLTVLTSKQLKSLQRVIAQHIYDIYHHAEYLRECIILSNSIEDIDNIQWSYTQSQAI